MSDFDSTVEKATRLFGGMSQHDHDIAAIFYSSAIASMQVEAVAWVSEASLQTLEAGRDAIAGDKNGLRVDPLFTHAPPSAAAKIAEQDARIKELESQLVSTDQLSVHDIRIGMSALLQCEVSEIEAMDNRCYDESYQAVQRVIEAISLSVKQEKLFGNEIYQAAANHFEQKIKELEQQLAKLEVNHSLLRKHVRMAIDIKSMSDECYDFLTAAIRQIGGA